MNLEDVRKIAKELDKAFPPEEVRFRPIGKEYRGEIEVAAFIDARNVTERLNDVLGIAGWKDDYETLAMGEVRCKLSIKVGDEWVHRTDVGSMSDQPDMGDKCKAAHSDALKRAAVKFGVGLYLYRLKGLKGKYDGKRITEWPALPTWAIPEDCLPVSRDFANRVDGLLKQCAVKSKVHADVIFARLADKFGGYPAGTKLSGVQLRDARSMVKELSAWLDELVKSDGAQK